MGKKNIDIKKKLATKLVELLAIKDRREEDFKNSIENIFYNALSECGLDDFEIDDVINDYVEEYSFDDLFEMIIDIYSKNFTEDELLDLINFFSSKIGKIWINRYPIVMGEIMMANDEYTQLVIDKIIKK
jgi:hypothetical protein